MSFDRSAIASLLEGRKRVARVVVAAAQGSVPREVGASMLVWDGGQSGTIGGGALEWDAASRARSLLASGGRRLDRVPLGPGVGQCCGGAVTLLTEAWEPDSLARIDGPVVARPAADHGASEPPLTVRRVLARARSTGRVPHPMLLDGWMVEPLVAEARPLWIWGAGHVGRAIVAVTAPLPSFDITWIDTSPDRFPEKVPEAVTQLVSVDPAAVVAHAPREAEHLILTYSHALDLALCHALLLRGFRRCGLIGSATKWARFRSRLGGLGHPASEISRIRCPIGDPLLGKHPQAIAIGVAAELLRTADVERNSAERAGRSHRSPQAW